MELLLIAGVDISHARLVDLAQLADQAKSFYDWIETKFQITSNKSLSLDTLLRTCTQQEIHNAIIASYQSTEINIPFLFDGIGRTYNHHKACYYFFSWLIRDAPQQRLAPLIQKIIKNSGKSRLEVETEVLTVLITEYRANVKTFTWDAIREVIIDRLEGSRRSIRGHEKETVVRTALVVAIQTYFERHKNYGVYASINVTDGQILINNESYDVSVHLIDEQSQIICRILVAIKTRETEGGGHSHLFSRDILSAIRTARTTNPEDYLVVIIVAQNWSQREAGNLRDLVDHLVIFEMSPSEFAAFDNTAQNDLNKFIELVFDRQILPKRDR